MAYDKTNIFARILRGEIPCKKMYEDDYALAFEDIAPAAPVHVLVVPKGEYVSFHDFMERAPAGFVQGYFAAVRQVAQALHLADDGYRIISNHGADASQSVAHFHVHVLGGRSLGGLLESAA